MTTATTSTVTLSKGQALSWDESPTGFAQVDDLLRVNVVVGWYVGRRWKTRRVPARVAAGAARQAMFAVEFNPFSRAVRPRDKTFVVRD